MLFILGKMMMNIYNKVICCSYTILLTKAISLAKTFAYMLIVLQVSYILCFEMAHIHSSIEELTDDIIKPDTDKRNYRALKLKNEMKILIISDPETDKSAAAINVHIGA